MYSNLFKQKDYIVYKCITELLIDEYTCKINIKSDFTEEDKIKIFECILEDPNMDSRLWTKFLPKLNDLSQYDDYIKLSNCMLII